MCPQIIMPRFSGFILGLENQTGQQSSDDGGGNAAGSGFQATAENAARELQELRMQLERSRLECDRLRREVGYIRGQDM